MTNIPPDSDRHIRVSRSGMVVAMRIPKWTEAVILAGLLLGQAVLIGTFGNSAMAQSSTERSAVVASRDVLVATATARGTAPALVKLDLDKIEIPAKAQLELSVAPIAVSNERYIVVVSTADNTEMQLGSFSFYPPPREGDVQKFLVDARLLAAAMKADDKKSQLELSIRLVPVSHDKTLAGSALRIVGARFVGG